MLDAIRIGRVGMGDGIAKAACHAKVGEAAVEEPGNLMQGSVVHLSEPEPLSDVLERVDEAVVQAKLFIADAIVAGGHAPRLDRPLS